LVTPPPGDDWKPLANALPVALAALSGSGSGLILAFAQTFVNQLEPGADIVKLAALSCPR
jgi:hypothetical protein